MHQELSPRAQRLRDAGHKLTHARLTVLRVLEESGREHLTSAEVLERVDGLDSSIGRASVFRALDLLTSLCLIRPTYIESSLTPKYVLLPDGHHHHIICTNCHRVIEFEDCSLDGLRAELEDRLHVRLTGHLLEFYGLCEACLEADQSV
ncbi:MAG: transcriptional repressor [Anaerolineaceae bacterium]|nr:transcriptional repressor [Anaerolineaceae bacterium]